MSNANRKEQKLVVKLQVNIRGGGGGGEGDGVGGWMESIFLFETVLYICRSCKKVIVDVILMHIRHVYTELIVIRLLLVYLNFTVGNKKKVFIERQYVPFFFESIGVLQSISFLYFMCWLFLVIINEIASTVLLLFIVSENFSNNK